MVATEERYVNMSKSVIMEHCFKDEGKQETRKKGKHQNGFSALQGQKNELYERQDIYI